MATKKTLTSLNTEYKVLKQIYNLNIVTAHMKIVLLLIILLTSNLGYCQESEKWTAENLKIELAEFLVTKNQIKSNNKRINFRGIYKNQVSENLKNGIYIFNNGATHSLSFFVIVDNSSFSILDISTLQGLKASIARTLEFANKQNYCSEITESYISKLIAIHYRINRNQNRRLDKNCEFESKPTKSTLNQSTLKNKLVEFLIEKKEIKDIKEYNTHIYDLYISKMGNYYGVVEEKKMDCGIFTFGYLDEDKQNSYYLILHESSLDFFDIESSKNLSEGINKILNFSENQKYCHLKTIQIIKQLIRSVKSKSCFANPTFELP